MSKVNLAIPLAALLAACNPSDKGGDSENTTGTFVPPSTDSGDTGASAPVPVDVAAIGFQYIAGWNEETGELEPVLYPDIGGTNGGNPFILSPAVKVTLANSDYFTASGPDNPNNYCSFFATFDATASTDLKGTTFDWDKGDGGLGDTLETWGGVEGSLTVLPDTFDDTCFGLDEYMWPGQTPEQVLDGMHFGIGFGPLSAYLTDLVFPTTATTTTTTTTLPPLTAANFLTEYIAINHSDGAGGFTFPAYDWDYALYVQADYTQCEQVYYAGSTATPFDLCGMVLTDDAKLHFLVGDTSVHPIHGYVAGNAYWYEDIPNIDLSILKDGVP